MTTYKELLELLNTLTEDQLCKKVTAIKINKQSISEFGLVFIPTNYNQDKFVINGPHFQVYDGTKIFFNEFKEDVKD